MTEHPNTPHLHGPACACGHDHAREGELRRPVAPSLLASSSGGRLALAGIALVVVWAATFWALNT